MERLTSRDEKGNLNVDGKEVYAGYLYNAVALLEEYEDTGLTPEQIMELKLQLIRLLIFSLISILHRVIQTEWKKQNC